MSGESFVLDGEGKQLSPTKEVKAWYMIRKGKAKLVSKYPMTIQLIRSIPEEEICKDEIRMGIDDGSLHVGVAIVQKGQKKNKVLMKGTIEQRKDVKKLMDVRRSYRKYRRSYKRYRAKRFDNRASSRRKGRLAPSILQKKQSILRVVDRLNKYIKIDSYYLEDVAIDTQAMTYGYKPYKWQYQKSKRLDENIRKAIIYRDGCKCMQCGKHKKGHKLEVHHIKPRRLNGSDTLDNLITLCSKCHQKTEGKEEQYMNYFYSLLNVKRRSVNLNHAFHVMLGKNYLRNELEKRGKLELTTGGDTANKRIDWDIDKTHSNDAICITDLKPNNDVKKDWIIKPMRRKSKAKSKSVLGFKHRDIVSYIYKNGKKFTGYVTALYPELNALNFQSETKHCNKVNAKKCKFIWRPNKIYFM